MLHDLSLDRFSDPETVAAMMAAFNAVCVSASARLGGNDDARRKLARIILLQVDQGDRDAARLSTIAYREFAGLNGAASASLNSRRPGEDGLTVADVTITPELWLRDAQEGRPEPIVPNVDQATLAEMIGTTRSRVSHFMNKFRQLGLIEYNGDLKVHLAAGCGPA